MGSEGRRWVMVNRPGSKMLLSDLELRGFELPELQDGEVRVRVLAHTLSPGMRAHMIYTLSTLGDPMMPGDPIPGDGLGVVEASRHPGFSQGDHVTGRTGWATHAVLNGARLTKLDPQLFRDLPPESALGVLGTNGLTAYVGLFEVAKPKAGETVLVSSAAGSVGYLAGQMAIIAGCDVVGMAGTDKKCEELKSEFGLHDTINYRAVDDLAKAIRAKRPAGYDIFFDNVGGKTLDAGVQGLRHFGRAVMCGRLANYSEGEPQVSHGLGPSDRLTLQGFVVNDYVDVLPVGLKRMSDWMREGKLVQKMNPVQGIEQSAATFLALFEGTVERPIIMTGA